MKELKILTPGIKVCLPVVPQWMENKPEYVTKNILRKNCLLQQVTEGKIQGGI
jgi:hypothetical protein